jgi:hypothetical protein
LQTVGSKIRIIRVPSNPTRLKTLAAAAALAAQRSANNNPRRWIMPQRFKKHLQRLAPHQRVDVDSLVQV